MKLAFQVSSWALCAALGAQVRAQTPAIPAADEEDLGAAFGAQATISLATGSRQSLRRAPAVATVITAQDIAAMGPITFDQLMETVPGLHVSVKPSSYDTIYVMRGAYNFQINPQVLLMRNGVPMSSIVTGDKGGGWGSLPVENIARIEIMRGPGSALYGADAFAGVINIITKNADDLNGTELGLRVGAFKSWDAWIQHGGKIGSVQVAAYLRAGTTDGQSELIEADAATRLDKIFGTHASLAPGPVSTGHRGLDAGVDLSWGAWRLRSGQQWRPKTQLGSGVSLALDPNHYQNSRRNMTELVWSDPALGQHWGAGASWTYLHFTERTPLGLMLFPPGTRIGPNVFPDGTIGGPSRWQRQHRLSAYVTYGGWSGHALRLGVGHEDLNLYATKTVKNFLLSSTGVPIPTGPVIDYSTIQPHLPPTRRRNDYVYLQDEWQFAPDWTLTAGLRHDMYSDFGNTTNPRLALVWDFSYNLTVKLLHGQAFRAPTVDEQSAANPVSLGNPAVKPERVRTNELAFDWHASRAWQFKLSLFDYDARDIIRSVANPPPATGSSYQNAGRLKGRGFELEAAWEVQRNLRAIAQLSQQSNVDQATGQDAGYAPRQHWFARLDWRPAGAWQIGAQFNAVKDRRRAPGDVRPAIADYRTVDLNLRQAGAGKGLEWAMGVRNLFDADVREPSQPGGTLPNDAPQAGRSWSVESSYRF